MDKEATREAKRQGEEAESTSPKPGEEDLTALGFLNSVFKEFPEWTYVSRHNLGEDDAQFVLDKLKNEDPDFINSLMFGVSWHHSGNNAKMRNATEMLFREKFLNVVVATSTLAQGIHMPCKTVVFAGDSVFLESLTYNQCAGRAGRRGFDQDGNVIFFGIKTAKISRLMTANLPKMIGNTPTSLSLILRLFILTSQTGK